MTEHILYDRPRQRHSLPPGSVADLIDHFLQVPCHLQQPLWRMASRTRQNYQKARTITHCNWSFRLTNGYTSEWLSPAGLPLQELQSVCCATFTLQPSYRFLRAKRWCQKIRINRSLSNATTGPNTLKICKLHSIYSMNWSDIDILSISIQYFSINIRTPTNSLHLLAVRKFTWKFQVTFVLNKGLLLTRKLIQR